MLLTSVWVFPSGSDSKESAFNVGNPGFIPGLGRCPGEGNGNPLQYSCLGNPLDRGAWRALVHEIAKSRTWLSNEHTASIMVASQVKLVIKNLPASVGDLRGVGLIPGSEKHLGQSTPYSCLENPMDRGAWWAAVHRVAKSQTRLKGLSMRAQLPYCIAAPPTMLPVLLNADCVPWGVLITLLTSAKLIFQTSLRRGAYRFCYISILIYERIYLIWSHSK